MSTFLFDKVIFGPINSRRLGLSLGINLLHPTAKLCNFDCIYCECGWNADNRGGGFNPKEEVLKALELKLKEMAAEGQLPSYITFAGNGEPTMHPKFNEVIRGTLEIRDRLSPHSKVAVLSNAMMLDRREVCEALRLVDRPILKLDSALQQTVDLINQPQKRIGVERVVELLTEMGGDIIIQTMFIRGEYNGRSFDNTTKVEVERWLTALKRIKPKEVMLYSVARDTPCSGVEAVDRSELERIALLVEAIGIAAVVS